MTRLAGPTVALVSLGCPKNLVDSEKMLAQLAEQGCLVGAPADEADVIVVNTCGFIAAAREESLAVIREALAHKAARQARRVVVAGCLAQRDAAALRRALRGVDAIVGVNNREDLAAAVLGPPGKASLTAAEPYRRSRPHIADDSGRLRLTPAHTAYLRISEGCGQGCSFCTIPAIRGPFRSKPVPMVLREAAELAADGAVELNVIGQDTTSYGRDIGYAPGLAGLLGELDAVAGVRWVRLMYAYPSLVDDRLLDAIAGCERVAKYLDLPLQHVADGVLRAMRRRITRRQTLDLLERIRRRVPGLALRTTFIVGFPGETARDFAELLAVVKDFRFDAVGVFEYSKEAGTAAAKLSPAVPRRTAQRRRETLMLAQQEIAFAANAARLGQTLEVLVDGADAAGRCVARHAGQAPEVDSVCYLTARRRAGRFVRAVVTGAEGYDLICRPIRGR